MLKRHAGTQPAGPLPVRRDLPSWHRRARVMPYASCAHASPTYSVYGHVPPTTQRHKREHHGQDNQACSTPCRWHAPFVSTRSPQSTTVRADRSSSSHPCLVDDCRDCIRDLLLVGVHHLEHNDHDHSRDGSKQQETNAPAQNKFNTVSLHTKRYYSNTGECTPAQVGAVRSPGQLHMALR